MIPGPVLVLLLMVAFLAYFIRRMVAGRSTKTGARTKDWLLYLVLTPLIICALVGLFLFVESKGIEEEAGMKWMNILVTAAFVFGYAARKFWQYRERGTFWVGLSVLVVAHFVVLQRLHWQKASYFWMPIIVGLPEMFGVFFLMGLIFQSKPVPQAEDFPK